MSVIPELWRLRQEDCKLEASLGYIARPCVKKESKWKKMYANTKTRKCTEEKIQMETCIQKLSP
jgi:hypothetical protein